MSTSRLRWLEDQLERDDLTDLQFDSYNREANLIQADLNATKEKQKIVREQQLQEAKELALQEKYLAITDEEVEEMYVAFYKVHAGRIDSNGRTFEDWFEQAKSLYDINLAGKYYQVVSRAKSDGGFVWDDFVSVNHAKTKILDLIKQKFRDHHLRPDREGCDFANIPQETISPT